MLKLTWIEFFLRLIPESLLFIYASYSFSRQAINKKKLVISSLLLAIMGYLIRLLPINYGVHTILILIVFIILMVIYNNVDMIKGISTSVVTVLLTFICEGINVFIIENIFKVNMAIAFEDKIVKLLWGIPSLLFLLGLVFIYNTIVRKRKE